MTSPKLPAVSLDDLIAVNDEIQALVRAGVPLGKGLLDGSRDVGGRLGRITRVLAERIESGASLGEALADETNQIPPMYRAIVAAGIRSGRLAAALEGMATSARRLADLRRMLGTALVYPLVVLSVAYAVLILFVTQVVPVIRALVVDAGRPVPWFMDALARAGESVHYWWPTLPALLMLLGLWWLASRSAAVLSPTPVSIGLEWIPWVRAAAASGRNAALAEVLALLIEHGVPLPEGLRLAGNASGNRRVIRETERLAVAAGRGQPLWKPGETSLVFPPLLRWLMSSGDRGGSLGKSLHHVAQTYHRRAARQVDAARVYLPAVMTMLLGGGATLFLALCLYLPLVDMLAKMAG